MNTLETNQVSSTRNVLVVAINKLPYEIKPKQNSYLHLVSAAVPWHKRPDSDTQHNRLPEQGKDSKRHQLQYS